ncbi:alcohol dehydrogenase [Lentibacillus kapialis]|uniref:Alcohol dehydrogenase n=1 Tax=Lentibacillus kapialis TaxID=340214 RepID=A0A917PX87_9BACI|nr:zinc-dependent alcohol dehydrogenase family protein [Lentibacillus kapialis]GGJ98411.1 alcohol dehydrogenase [Lentibacillus kapialis]
MKVKSAVLTESGATSPYVESLPIKIETLDLDPPGEGEVLVNIKAASLCHSDLSVVNGTRPRPTPMALGHEASGVVDKVGEGVHNFVPGDKVVCVFVPSCGNCLSCREGRPALCEVGGKANNDGTLLNGNICLHKNGKDIYHHLGVSAFSDYVVVNKNSLVKVNNDIPFDKLALFGCAVITGVGAVTNTADIKFGSTVAIVGLGGVGLSALMGAIAAGASHIIAIDINDEKLKYAKKLGATDTFNSKDKKVIDEVLKASIGGVDYAFETAGAIAAMEVAYGITKRGGSTVTTGLPNPEQFFSFPYVTLTAEEKSIKGSYVGSCVPQRDIPRFIDLYGQNKLPVDELHTDTISLKEINEGFDKLENGEALRIVIDLSK